MAHCPYTSQPICKLGNFYRVDVDAVSYTPFAERLFHTTGAIRTSCLHVVLRTSLLKQGGSKLKLMAKTLPEYCYWFLKPLRSRV